jgi:hypothetical protein
MDALLCSALLCSALLCSTMIVGCEGPTATRPVATKSPGARPDAQQISSSPGASAHDFGPVLADDRVLRHEFRLRNDSSRAIRVVEVVAIESGGLVRAKGPLPTRPAALHALAVRVDPSKLPRDRAANVRILTDDPRQPELSVTVVALQAQTGARP